MAKEFSIKPKLPKVVGAIIIIVAVFMIFVMNLSVWKFRFGGMLQFEVLASIFLGLVNVFIITLGAYLLLTGEIPLELKIKK